MLNSQEKPAAGGEARLSAAFAHATLHFKSKMERRRRIFLRNIKPVIRSKRRLFCNFTCENSTHFFNTRHDKNTT